MKKLIIGSILVFSSFALAKGNCNCPFDYDKRGNRCGGRSSFCRPGGAEPACGTKNNTEKISLRLNQC